MILEPPIVDALRAAKHVVIFTGAGISAESGIPTFRDALTGLWERYDPQDLATFEAFQRDPELVWGWYEWRRSAVMRARPNAGHIAIAAMELVVPKLTLITQNVDDLHRRAGSSAPIHMHGSLFEPRCCACGAPAALPKETPEQFPGGRRIAPPRCRHCEAQVRPGVVWFGEALPEAALSTAVKAASCCEVLFSIGTSSMVYPAADIPVSAARAGALVIQINPRATALDSVARYNLRETAARVLPEVLRTAWPSASDPAS